MHRNHSRLASLPCLALLLATAGCVSQSPYLDSRFGESVTVLKAQQIINPEASRNTDPVYGMDGRAARSAYDKYQKSYRVPEPQPNPFIIGIGGAR